MKISRYTILVFLFLLQGIKSCIPIKQIREVKTNLTKSYNGINKDTLNSASTSWKVFFNDTELNNLIDSALVNNQELKIFLQKIEVANNEIKIRKGEYLPFVNYKIGSEIDKVGEFTRNGSVESNLPIKEDKTFPDPLSNFSLGLNASWELDIWKKLRNSKKAAIIEYLSTIEGKNFIITNLVTEIASAYYELLALDNQLVIINKNLEIQRNALKIVKIQKKAARTTELAVKRFEAELSKNKSRKFEIKQSIVEIENQINFLIGKQPSSINRNSDNFLKKTIDSVFTGIPVQLLSNRPDIRKAEFELEASKLNVKIARANFYPSFSLRAGIGLEAFKTKFLTSTPQSLIYNLSGDIVGPLINRNAIKATYKNANAKQLASIYEYEKTVLNSYIEVINNLSKIENLKNKYAFKNKQVEILTKSIEVSNTLYQSARADYMEVLLTQREALDSKMELIDVKKDRLIARVNLYRSLGGGWK